MPWHLEVAMKRFLGSVAAVAFMSVMVLTALGFEAEQAPRAKHSVKEVMQGAHKSGLLKKVLQDEASQEEKLELLDHYVSLAENKPIKGDAKAWEEKTNAIVLAAAKATVGRDDGTELLQKVTNCMACHKEHRPAAK